MSLRSAGRTAASTLRPWLDRLILFPLFAGVIFLVSLALQYQKILRVLYWNSDITFLPLLAEDLTGLRNAGAVNLGDTPYFSTLWILSLTKGLPFHRTVWQVGPYVLAVITALILAVVVYKLAGKWAAAGTFVVSTATAPTVLVTQVVPGVRVTTWFACALTAGSLVVCARSLQTRGLGPALMAALAATAVVAGTTAASDPLFLAAGLVPLVGAALLIWAFDRTRVRLKVLAAAALVAGAALPVAWLTGVWMNAQGFSATLPRKGFVFVTEEQLLSNVPMVVESLLRLGNGGFFGLPLGAGSAARLVAAAAAAAGLLIVIVQLAGLRSGGAGGRQDRSVAGEPDDDPAGDPDEDPVGTLRDLWVAFWGLAALGVLGATLFSTVAVGSGVAATRYLVPVYYACAAVVPLWATGVQARRIAVTGCVVLVAALATRDLASFYRGAEAFALIDRAERVREFLESEDLDRGYAAYWTAHAFTWKSDLQIRVYPVDECRLPASDVLCPFELAVRDSWYEPQRGRSFILLDPTTPARGLSEPPSPSYGEPAEVRRFGELSVYVYDHDVAAHFEDSVGPP